MINEFTKSMVLIFMAEMGDKTQILAMAFAVQYKVKEVLLGVFLGSLVNHGLAVILGAYLSNIIPIGSIQIMAGFLFIGFGLLALKADEEDEDEEFKKNLGPILTVALAFFIGELGDKTQLAAITLASDATFPLFILIGTVSGMVLTSGIGILIGSTIGDRIPEVIMKLASASIFILFGTMKLYTSVPKNYMTSINVSVFFTLLTISIYLILKPTLALKKDSKSTALKEAALTLYEYTNEIKESVEGICLGERLCGKCQGKRCIIGYTKKMLDDAAQNKISNNKENWKVLSKSLNKTFNKEKIIDSLSMIIVCLMNNGEEKSIRSLAVNKARKMLEHILFYQTIKYDGNKERYYERLREKDSFLAKEIICRIEGRINENSLSTSNKNTPTSTK